MAILAVFAYHSGTFLRGSFIGVDIFFVLSGFLITTLLLQEWVGTGSIAIGDFYRRRAARLLPALFVTIAGVGVIYVVYPRLELHVDLEFAAAVLAVMFYASNWFLAVGNHVLSLGLLDHTWSLALEEQFYLIWPPLLLLCLRRSCSLRRLLFLAAALACASAILRVVLWNTHRGGNIYFRSDTRADGLLLGCALAAAYSMSQGRELIRRYLGRWEVGFAAAVALLVFAVKFTPGDRFVYNAGLAGVNVCSAVVVAHVVCSERSLLTKLLSVRPVVWIGARSYGMYLFHIPIFAVIGASWLGDQQGRFRIPIQIALTMLAAAASYRWIESYFLRRNRLRGAPPHVQRAPTEH
jgi:peptidoglycan/LPS O-acetylase OafA/YrhL